MAQAVTTEMNEFSRLSDDKILLDGLVWTSNPDKAIELKDPDNGFKIHSIKMDETYYYPCGIDKRKK